MEATLSLPRDLIEDARDRLGNSPYMAVRGVSCEFLNGRLLLRGRLPNFHHKQIAQETVRSLVGPRQIINEIEVID